MLVPEFEYIAPENIDEVFDSLHKHGDDCRLLAGGTDIIVRMKQGLIAPDYLISLKLINDLSYLKTEDGFLKIGSGTTLKELSDSKTIETAFPGFHQAIQAIGAPTIQHYRGTIGGNLCQETRCLFYNQSEFFRTVKQPCHKAGGQTCYAREESDRCHSTHQSDCAPILIALDAKAVLRSKENKRIIPLVDLYSTRGEAPLSLAPDEILTEIKVPLPEASSGNSYKRLSYRSAIDFPIASAGVFIETADSSITKAMIVVGAIGRAPLFLAQASKILEGISIEDKKTIQEAAKISMDSASAFAVNNVGATVEYRVLMVSVLVKRAIEECIKMIN